ncbi:PEP-CTERM sorting domain-containing protein [Pikeienuella sp. HZG-20]|uniref:PEP-CTERM sorting domain-containing protein n=1 Tax=Paludibacillus litoralis TaxID=3133267 RepID=UPI0030EDB1F2
MKHLTIAGAALAIAGFSLPQSAEAASYFVRPFIQVGAGGLIDGLQQNGATNASQNFGTNFQSTVDLDDGTVKARTNIPSAQSNGQSGASFGERVAFSPDAAGTNVSFSFDFDGTIEVSDLLNGPLATGYSAFVFANLFVYDSTAGATYQNFTSLGGALISRTFAQDYGTSSGATPSNTFFDVDRTLSGSITVEANKRYDVFASLSIAAATNQNDISIMMDFMNTGTFGIDADPGVTYTSSSGVFLDSTGVTPPPSPVPVPAALPLLLGGLGLLGFVSRRRRAAAA